MSCKHENKGPLHIKNFRELKQQATPCNNNICEFVYNFSNCHCIITNKSTYLDINCCKNNNTLTYNGSQLRVERVKLYLPSLNYYNDGESQGELIIYCSGGMQKPTVVLCIPMKTTLSSTKSTKWFSKFGGHVPNKNQSHQVNVQNYTLNDVIPQCGFGIFNGSMHEPPCHSKGIMLLFDPEYSIQILQTDFDNIKKKLTSPTILNRYPIKKSAHYKELVWNSVGTSGGYGTVSKKQGGKWKLTCNPIVDQNNKYLAGGPRSSFVTPKIPELSEKTKTILIIVGVVMGVLLLGWYVIIPYAKPAWDNVSRRFKKKKEPDATTGGGGRKRRRR